MMRAAAKSTAETQNFRVVKFENINPAGEENGGGKGDDCRADKSHDHGLKAVHHSANHKAFLKGHIALGHDKNDDKGGENHAEGGAKSTEHAGLRAAHIGGDVYGEGSGSGLAHRHEVYKLLLAEPVKAENILLNKGQHGISSAEGEQSDFKEGPKEGEINHNVLPSFCAMIVAARPMAAAEMMIMSTLKEKTAEAAKARAAMTYESTFFGHSLIHGDKALDDEGEHTRADAPKCVFYGL